MILVVVTSAATSAAVTVALAFFRRPRPVDTRAVADLIGRTAPGALGTMRRR